MVPSFIEKLKRIMFQILMEYCGLGSVQDTILLLSDGEAEGEENKVVGLCEADIAYILKSVISGLVYLHSKNIIHRYNPGSLRSSVAHLFLNFFRDLKAGNILLTEEGFPKIGKLFLSLQSLWTYPSFLFQLTLAQLLSS